MSNTNEIPFRVYEMSNIYFEKQSHKMGTEKKIFYYNNILIDFCLL